MSPHDAPRASHVVIATRLFHPESAAAALRLKVLSDAFAEADADVTVLTSRFGSLGSTTDGRVTVSRWPVRRDSTGVVRGYLSYMSFDVPLVWRLLTVRRPDLVISEPPPTTGAVVRLVCGLRRVPYAYYAADIWSDAVSAMDEPTLVAQVLRRVESFALRGARTVLAVSEQVRERATELGARDTMLVQNGVDTSLFTAIGPGLTGEEYERHGLTPGRFLVYAGTASEWQGAGIFVDAFRLVREEFPDAKLVYMGQGSDWDTIVHAARDLGDSVLMLPPQPPADAARFMRSSAGVLVSIRPDVGYDFAYPTKVLAGLASGAPVLYAGVGPATQDLRVHDLGVAADYDPDAVADAMRLLLADPPGQELRSRLHRWVAENRSMNAEARRAAQSLLESIRARVRQRA